MFEYHRSGEPFRCPKQRGGEAGGSGDNSVFPTKPTSKKQKGNTNIRTPKNKSYHLHLRVVQTRKMPLKSAPTDKQLWPQLAELSNCHAASTTAQPCCWKGSTCVSAVGFHLPKCIPQTTICVCRCLGLCSSLTVSVSLSACVCVCV